MGGCRASCRLGVVDCGKDRRWLSTSKILRQAYCDTSAEAEVGDITAVIENLSKCSLSRSIWNAPSEVVRANWQTLSFHSKGPLLFLFARFRFACNVSLPLSYRKCCIRSLREICRKREGTLLSGAGWRVANDEWTCAGLQPMNDEKMDTEWTNGENVKSFDFLSLYRHVFTPL